MESSVVRVGVLGCGTVGASVVELLAERAPAIERRAGIRLQLARVAVRDLARPRAVDLPPDVLTDDAASVVTDPGVDLVVEVMGGVEPARTLLLAAIEAGKPVVTANKELLACAGSEMFFAADAAGVDVLFEAAVAGGIPLVRPLRESLVGEPVERVLGIVNGTTNYILTRMTEEGVAYDEALAEAQALGYAEADPTADVGGYDSAAKIAILATIAFGARVVVGDVHHEGIAGITPGDIAYAARKGLVVKLLAIAELIAPGEAELAGTPLRAAPGEIAVRVHPVMLPATHPLAAVRDSFNAVFVEGAAVGGLMFYGRGAGGRPTASAVLGDLVDAALNLRKGAHASLGVLGSTLVQPVDDLACEYYLVVEATDRPGVLASIAGVFGAHGVSIAATEQELPPDGDAQRASIMFVTHRAREGDVQAAVRDLRDLDVVHRVGSLIRFLPGDGRS